MEVVDHVGQISADLYIFIFAAVNDSQSHCWYASLTQVRGMAQLTLFSFTATLTKSIYKEGNWLMEPDSLMLHFHPSIFDLSLLYLMQGCWRLSWLTGLHPQPTALQFIRTPITGYGLSTFLSLQQAPELPPGCKEQGSGLEMLSYLCVEADASLADLSERICDHILWHHTGTASLL